MASAQKLDGFKLRILVVGDNRDTGDDFIIMLGLMGHEVHACNRGPEVVAACEAFHPHVVFLNLAMPGLNGFQVAQVLRERNGLPGPVIVALTEYGSDPHRENTRKHIDHFLLKPAERLDVEKILAEAVNKAANNSAGHARDNRAFDGGEKQGVGCLLDRVDARPKYLVVAAGFAGAALLGVGDYFTSWELSFGIFYLLPIFLVTYRAGKWPGIFLSVTCASIWFAVEATTNPHYSSLFFPLWNALVRLSYFIINTLLLAALREALLREKELADMIRDLSGSKRMR